MYHVILQDGLYITRYITKWIIYHVPLHLVVADEPYIVESRSVTGSVESGYIVGYI